MQCPTCKAPYTQPIPSFGEFVRCEYCGTNIPIVRQNVSQAKKHELDIGKFITYLDKKGLKFVFDEVTNRITYHDKRYVIIGTDGSVEGDPSFKIFITKWLNQFINR